MTSEMTISDRFRDDAIACLVQLVRDESASSAARASAARDILNWSVGRPQQAKQISVADLAEMTPEQRHQLLQALLTHYCPDGFQAILKQSVDEALARLPPPSSPKFGFTRRPR